MEVIATPLQDCFVIRTKVHGDDRGFFLESFNQKQLASHGIHFEVKQINFAKSQQNVLRGLHFQNGTDAQAKLVGVVHGAVLDVVVDIRRDSPTFLQHFALKIDSRDTFLFIPRGFAHGYYTLADETLFYYAVDNFYAPANEGGIRYDDPALGIDWQLQRDPLVSAKDLNHPTLDLKSLTF